MNPRVAELMKAVKKLRDHATRATNMILEDEADDPGVDKDLGTSDFDDAVRGMNIKQAVMLAWKRGVNMATHIIDGKPILVYVMQDLKSPKMFVSLLTHGGQLGAHDNTTLADMAIDLNMTELGVYLVSNFPSMKRASTVARLEALFPT